MRLVSFPRCDIDVRFCCELVRTYMYVFMCDYFMYGVQAIRCNDIE